MKYLLLSGCFLMLFSSCSSQQAPTKQTASRQIKVLIIDGFSNHDWRATTSVLKSILAQDKTIETTVSTIPQETDPSWQTWSPAFQSYDVIIQNTNDIGNKRSWPKAAQKSFEIYMAQGGGMLVNHSANNAFPQWSEYNKMIGLGWRKKDFGPAIIIENNSVKIIPKGQGQSTSHGPRFNALITRLAEHPIHKGLPKQWLAADLEVYRYARGPAENLEVLSYAEDPKLKINFPIEWTVKYAKGRIYNSTYGHHWHNLDSEPAGMRCVAFRTLFLRAIHWLARSEISDKCPPNFPSSLSDFSPFDYKTVELCRILARKSLNMFNIRLISDKNRLYSLCFSLRSSKSDRLLVKHKFHFIKN